jgi:hypothetical protein
LSVRQASIGRLYNGDLAFLSPAAVAGLSPHQSNSPEGAMLPTTPIAIASAVLAANLMSR